jgi:hypothetical protein
MNAPVHSATVAELRSLPALQQVDLQVNMFSLRGFELAQRIAKAFAASDAVPTQFRSVIEKKSRSGSTFVENQAALGNCIVAIETAQAVGMSITAVMQNANVIEGQLRWSGKFVIAAINASGRFTTLQFDVVNKGRMKAKYREKLGWNDQKRGFDFADREVEIDNWECRAWAYRMENGRPTTTRVEGAKVSMKMAVEEGWYSKPGSKWQTEMYELMLQYRAGSFFGNIHAPDIVMGMGRTAEEVHDTTTVDVNPDGTVGAVTTEQLRRPRGAEPPQKVEEVAQREAPPEGETGAGADVGEASSQGDASNVRTTTANQQQRDDEAPPVLDAEKFSDELAKAKDLDSLAALADRIRDVLDQDMAATLTDVYQRRKEELEAGTKQPPASRRSRGAQASME